MTARTSGQRGEEDARIVAMLKRGKTSRDVSRVFRWSMAYASHRCTQVRAVHGIPLVHAGHVRRKREHPSITMRTLSATQMRTELARHLGADWVSRLVGDDDESADLLRLYIALRAEMIDARPFMLAVHARLAVLSRARLDSEVERRVE